MAGEAVDAQKAVDSFGVSISARFGQVGQQVRPTPTPGRDDSGERAVSAAIEGRCALAKQMRERVEGLQPAMGEPTETANVWTVTRKHSAAYESWHIYIYIYLEPE